MGKAIFEIKIEALMHMLFPVDGVGVEVAGVGYNRSGELRMWAVLVGENVPDTDMLAPVYREIEGLRDADGHRLRAYLLERLHAPDCAASNQGGVNSMDDLDYCDSVKARPLNFLSDNGDD